MDQSAPLSADAVIAAIHAAFFGRAFEISPDLILELRAYGDALAKNEAGYSDAQRASHKEKMHFFDALWNTLSSIQPADKGEADVLCHLYNVLCKINYLLTDERSDRLQHASSAGAVADLQHKRYFALNPDVSVKAERLLDRFWQSLETCDTPHHPIKSFYPGYSSYELGIFKNQRHLNALPPGCLEDVRRYMIETDLAVILEQHFKSKIGICNVRSWRYLPDESAYVVQHRDKVGPGILKIMIYRGDITREHGCFEMKIGEDWVPVTGRSPHLLCDTGWMMHRAQAPRPGYIRDNIEITVMPRRYDDLIAVNAGYCAGRPVNPFANWTAA